MLLYSESIFTSLMQNQITICIKITGKQVVVNILNPHQSKHGISKCGLAAQLVHCYHSRLQTLGYAYHMGRPCQALSRLALSCQYPYSSFSCNTGGPGGHEVEHESVVCPCHKES